MVVVVGAAGPQSKCLLVHSSFGVSGPVNKVTGIAIPEMGTLSKHRGKCGGDFTNCYTIRARSYNVLTKRRHGRLYKNTVEYALIWHISFLNMTLVLVSDYTD
jgi:hypothetical protein